MSVYPDEHSWLVQLRLETGEWGTCYPTDEKIKAYERLEKGRAENPGHEYRIVKATTVYTQECPDQADDVGFEDVLAFITTEAKRQRDYVEHASEKLPADTESDNT